MTRFIARIGRFILSLTGWAFTLLFTGLIAGGIAAVLIFQHYSKDLPDYSQLSHYDPPTVTRLYAADGRLLAEYATEKRVFVPLSAIPKRVRQAFISAEDKNFYAHTGVDITGIGRAVYYNILHYGHGRSLAGGSTITQQVVKNFLLSDEKSFERKVKEAILALRISQVYSKDKILELYLNEIYLGMRSYGVAAAALNFFNKPLDELTTEEAALLAAMPKAPSSYDPRRNYDAAKARRDWVIGRMAEDGAISEEEAQAAAALPITLRLREADDVVRAEFFAEEVRRSLAAQYGENVLYEGGLVVKTTLEPALQKTAEKALRKTLIDYDRTRGYRGSLARVSSLAAWPAKFQELAKKNYPLINGQQLAVVSALDDKRAMLTFGDGKTTGTIPLALLKWTRTVIDDGVLGPEIKKPVDVLQPGDVVIVGPLSEQDRKKIPEAEAKTAWNLEQIPAVNGALVALDPHTGRVLAMAGGYAYAGNGFNRVTQARRQPGSAFKPFVYLAGLENGFTPSTIVLDAPVEMNQGAGLPTWKPQNYSGEYYGPTTLRVGLEKSRNTMTVRLAQLVGIEKTLEIGKRFAVYDKPPRNFSIVLGSVETTLLRLANAYGMIVNGGKRITPGIIERIDDRHGKTIFRRDARECQGCAVFNPEQTAMDSPPPLPQDTREQVLDPRVAYQMVSMLEGVVSRGTATRARVLERPVAGKTGTTNKSMDAWFVGFTPDLVVGVFVGFDKPKTLGRKETGGSVALPAFIDFMQEALADKPAVPFRIPPGVQLSRVNLKTGLPAEEGETGPEIQEAFITGAPIFVPGVTPPTPAQPALGSVVETPPEFGNDSGMEIIDGDLTGQTGQNDQTGGIGTESGNNEPEAVVVPAPSGAPVVGTGGLY